MPTIKYSSGPVAINNPTAGAVCPRAPGGCAAATRASGPRGRCLDRVVSHLDFFKRVVRVQHDGGHRAVALVCQNHGRQLREEIIGPGQLRIAGHPINAKGREADGVVASEGIERPGCASGAAAGFGYEQRVPVLGVLGAEPREVAHAVDVGRDDVNTWSAAVPDIHDQIPGAAAGGRKLTRDNAVHCGVGVHRYGVFGLAGVGHPAHVARIVPGHEDAFGPGALAEGLFPGAGGFETGGGPVLAELGMRVSLCACR